MRDKCGINRNSVFLSEPVSALHCLKLPAGTVARVFCSFMFRTFRRVSGQERKEQHSSRNVSSSALQINYEVVRGGAAMADGNVPSFSPFEKIC